jgi:hypothetical protein
VMLEMIDSIDTHVGLGRALVGHHHDRNLLRPYK